MNLSTSEYQES